MKHSLLAAARAAPIGLLATAALSAMAAQKFDAETAPTLAPVATDLDTGQPQAIASDAKTRAGRMHLLQRDSTDLPVGVIRGKRVVVGTDKAKGDGDGYHRRREVALN